MFDSRFTNIFGDTEIDNTTPDAEQDWFLLSDYGQDAHYTHSKICDSFKALYHVNNDCYIVRGGIISDNGDGTIAISEGTAISKDSDGNARFVYIPALTNIDIPSTPVDWKDDRQLWIVLKYDYKLSTATRNHFVGDNYHYQLEDTYLGDTDGLVGGSTNDLFVDTDPNSVADTIVCLGSFQMSAGDVYTELSSTERTENIQATELFEHKSTYNVKLGETVTKDDIVRLVNGDIETVNTGTGSYADIIGIAKESATSGNSCVITDLSKSYYTSNLSGLVNETMYYCDNSGKLSSVSPSTTSFIVGIAEGTTRLKVIGKYSVAV